MKKVNQALGIAAVLIGILLFSGCSKKSEVKSKPYVLAYIWSNSDNYNSASIRFIADPVPESSDVSANVIVGHDSYHLGAITYYLPGFLYLRNDSVPMVEPGQQVSIRVSSETYGHSEGEAIYPGPVNFYYPIQDTTYQFGENISLSWSNSTGASRYWLNIYIYKIDSSGISHVARIDTLLTSTNYVLSSSYFVNDGSYYEIHAYVWAANGAFDRTNMTGDFKGFWITEGKPDFRGFFVGSHKNTKGVNIKRPSREKIQKAFMEKMNKRFKEIIETENEKSTLAGYN